MKKLLWWLIAGTRGGPNRARIINLLYERPYNANQLSEELKLDYKTVKHHLNVLKKNQIINTPTEDSYGKMYFLSNFMENNYKISLFIQSIIISAKKLISLFVRSRVFGSLYHLFKHFLQQIAVAC